MAATNGSTGLTGGCQCGAVRYRLDEAPSGTNICHCRMCQKASGGPFMAFGGVKTTRLVVTRGAIATFNSSEIGERGFCAACGTPLTYRGRQSERVSVTLGSLDDPGAVAPQTQLGVESRVPWLADSLKTPEIETSQWLAQKKIVSIGNHQHPDHET